MNYTSTSLERLESKSVLVEVAIIIGLAAYTVDHSYHFVMIIVVLDQGTVRVRKVGVIDDRDSKLNHFSVNPTRYPLLRYIVPCPLLVWCRR